MRTISVVIPVFNRREAARAAVASVRAQTHPIHEIIIVDDASAAPLTDADFTPPAGARTPPVRILRQRTNAGAAAARQAGVDAAEGDAVAFLDSDDLWAPEKIAAQSPLLADEEAPLAIVSGWRRILHGGRAGGVRIPVPAAGIEDFAAGCWFSPGSTLLIRKAVLRAIGPFDATLRRLEDYEFFLRFGLKGGSLRVAEAPLADIAIGARAATPAVSHAADTIAERHGAVLPAAALRRMRAYLDLERAAAARNEGRVVTMAARLARSWFAAPRLQPPLEAWWRRP